MLATPMALRRAPLLAEHRCPTAVPAAAAAAAADADADAAAAYAYAYAYAWSRRRGEVRQDLADLVRLRYPQPPDLAALQPARRRATAPGTRS